MAMPIFEKRNAVIMEPISTALMAVSAASNAIAFIKARVNDVQSVADLSEQIGTLFSAQKKLNEERNKQAGVSDVSFKGSIDAVLEAKRLNEEMQQIATMINMRWPKPADQPSTWQEIINHHNKALREQREAALAAAKAAAIAHDEAIENMKIGLAVFALVVVVVGLFIAVMVSTAGAIGLT